MNEKERMAFDKEAVKKPKITRRLIKVSTDAH